MGLDNFTDNEIGGNLKNNEYAKAGTTPKYTRDELINEIKRFKEENGKVTRKLFDEDDDFPSSNPIRREFGSWNQGLKAAIGDVNMEQEYSVSEWEGYFYMLKAVSKYGKDVTTKEILNDDELLTRNAIENATGMRFNEVKRYLGLTANQEKDISKQSVIEELKRLEPPLKVNKVNRECSFGHTVVSKYGDGSYTRGLEELGFETTSIQHITSNHKSQYSKRARDMLDRHESYNSDDSAYVYVLRLMTNSETEWFYIGKVNEDSSMHRRLTSHLVNDGDFTKELNVESIELHDILKADSKSINDKERVISYKTAIEQNTTNVLGGK